MSSPPAGSSDAALQDELQIALAASASGIGFWDWHLASDTVFLSREWKAQIGYGDLDIPGRQDQWEQRLHPDDAEPTLSRLRAHLADPRVPYEVEFRLRHKDGSYRWILARGVATRDAEGRPLRMVGCHVDVTERKASQRDVLESRHRYASLVQSIDGVVWEADARTRRFTYVSPRAETLLGYTPEQWLSEGFWAAHLHPDDRAAAVTCSADHVAGLEGYRLDYRMIAADGRVVWFRDAVNVSIKDGQPDLLRGLLLDISESKQEQGRAAVHQTRLRLSMELARLGSWELDLATRMLTLDDEVFRLLRTTAAAQGGHSMLQEVYRERFIPLEDRQALQVAMAAAVATGHPNVGRQVEHRVIRADGTVGFVTMRFSMVTDASGRTVRALGAIQDISEWKETETRLKWLHEGESLLSRLSQRFIDLDLADFDAQVTEVLRSVAEFVCTVRASLFVYSADGASVSTTQEWCADPADALREQVSDLPVGHYAFLRRELTANRVVRIESPEDVPRDTAESRCVETEGFRSLLLYPLMSRSRLIGVVGFYGPPGQPRTFDSDVRSFLLSFSSALANVLSRRAAEEERVSLERQLLQAHKMEAIGTLSGGIAHDFNNVLGAIIGNVGLARMVREVGGSVDDSLLEIERAAEHASALVQQILAFSRQQDHQRRAIALAPVVEGAIRLLRATLPASVSLEMSVGRDVPNVSADPTQMHQILLNLCANAWHAMEDAPGLIQVGLEAVTLTASAADRVGGITSGRFACLTVTDNGCGMDDATMVRVFDPFFTTKTVGKGTGLGMSVVHGIVRSHQGGISLSSQPGRGTVVTVYLPVATTAAREATEETPVVHGHGERILIVDDEESIVRVECRILERLGYCVTAFVAPLDALEAFRANPDAFDLVMTDYEMPEITGIAVAREVSRLKPGTPIVLCSGLFREEAREEAEAAGIGRFVTKPCGANVLSRVVSDLLTASPGH